MRKAKCFDLFECWMQTQSDQREGNIMTNHVLLLLQIYFYKYFKHPSKTMSVEKGGHAS